LPVQTFSAADASLGYAYQVRIALLRALELARKGSHFDVAVETLDDVSFSTSGGEPLELLQLKHSLQAQAGLSDASPALWKTLRIWSTKWQGSEIQEGVKLYLITTSVPSSGSAASFLKCSSRNCAEARRLLDLAASTSMNVENSAAYAEWKAMSPSAQSALLEQIEIIDGAPNILAIEDSLLEQIWGFVEAAKRHVFLEYLEGWWFRRVLRQLADDAPAISTAEIESQLDTLREQFQRDNLPIDEALLAQELDAALIESYGSHVFVCVFRRSRATVPTQARPSFRCMPGRW